MIVTRFPGYHSVRVGLRAEVNLYDGEPPHRHIPDEEANQVDANALAAYELARLLGGLMSLVSMADPERVAMLDTEDLRLLFVNVGELGAALTDEILSRVDGVLDVRREQVKARPTTNAKGGYD